jgi:hypothetical protein
MSVLQYGSGPTSNDLLESLIAEHALPALDHQIVAQSDEDARNLENAPAATKGPQITLGRSVGVEKPRARTEKF